MPSLSDVYGSGKFIKADSDGCIDIDGKPYDKVVTIETTRVHEFPPEKGETDGKRQITVAFRELPEMELGLNITNSRSIAKIANTEDWSHWPGTVIELCVVPEEKSRTGHAIRVRKPRAPAPTMNGQAPAVQLMGALAAGRLAERLAKEGRTLLNLKGWLTAKYPQYSSVLLLDPSNWPREVGTAVAEWFARPETAEPAKVGGGLTDEDIPFSPQAWQF